MHQKGIPAPDCGVGYTDPSPFAVAMPFAAVAQLLLLFITPIPGGMTDENSAYQRRYATDLPR